MGGDYHGLTDTQTSSGDAEPPATQGVYYFSAAPKTQAEGPGGGVDLTSELRRLTQQLEGQNQQEQVAGAGAGAGAGAV